MDILKLGNKPPQPAQKQKIEVNEITDKPLSNLLDEIRAVLKKHQHSMVVKISERNDKVVEVEITARIQF